MSEEITTTENLEGKLKELEGRLKDFERKVVVREGEMQASVIKLGGTFKAFGKTFQRKPRLALFIEKRRGKSRLAIMNIDELESLKKVLSNEKVVKVVEALAKIYGAESSEEFL